MKNNIGKSFRKRRRELDISQEELAQKINVARGYIAQIERGKCMPSAETALAISKNLRLNYKIIRKVLVLKILLKLAEITNSMVNRKSLNSLFKD